MSEIKEKCPVCKTECEEGATTCSVCGFTDELGINRTFPIPEDLTDWLETKVKPCRVQYEARKRENELLAQLEAARQRETELQTQIEAAKRTAHLPPEPPSHTQENTISKIWIRHYFEGVAFIFFFMFLFPGIGGIIGVSILNIIGLNIGEQYVGQLFAEDNTFFADSTFSKLSGSAAINAIGSVAGIIGTLGISIALPILYYIADDIESYDKKALTSRAIFMSIFTGIGGGLGCGISLNLFELPGGWPFAISFIIGGFFGIIGWLIIRKRET